MRPELDSSTRPNPPKVIREDCQPSGGGDVLCLAVLNRPLTERERVWFETAEAWRDPAPRRFLISGSRVSFLCGAEEKDRWSGLLDGYLDQAWKEA